jgi:hypothetical protein
MDNQLIAEIKKRGIPPLYAQEENSADPTIYLELSLFQFPWRWYASECEIEEGGDVLFFGFVNGDFGEWGYFRLSELESTRCPLLISYDFKPVPFSEVKKAYNL